MLDMSTIFYFGLLLFLILKKKFNKDFFFIIIISPTFFSLKRSIDRIKNFMYIDILGINVLWIQNISLVMCTSIYLTYQSFITRKIFPFHNLDDCASILRCISLEFQDNISIFIKYRKM